MFPCFVNVKVPALRIFLSQKSVWVKEVLGQGWGWEIAGAADS